MKTQINKELAALMQLDSAEQAIKTLLSSGVAPGTVAAQKVQQTAALTQAAPQSQAAPPGIEALLPGVQQQAAQAAQAAQPATQGDVNQLRQMLAQAAPPQMNAGVGGLGKDVQMAEGGVVGYAGPDGSDVELDVSGRIKKALRDWYERTERGYMERAGATPEMIAQKLGREAPVVERPRGQENYEPAPQLIVGNAPPVAPEAQRLMDRQRVPAPRSSGVERKQPAAETGIATLMGPPVPSGSERQFAESLSVLGRTVDPTKRTPEQIAAEREAVYRARGIEPGKAEQERIARLEAFDAQEEAARNKRIEKRGMQDLIQFLSSFGGAASMVEGGRRGTAASTQLQQGWERSDEAYNLLKRQRMDAIAAERVALANRNQALADGDIATAAREAEALRTAQNARLATEAKMRADFAVPMMQAETAAAQIAASAKEGAASRANQVLVAKLQLSKPSDLQERVALLSKDPAKFKQIYGDKTAVDLAELRAKLLADYSKNAMQLKTQNINSFDDYLALFGQSAITPGGASTPPPGAVREKGK